MNLALIQKEAVRLAIATNPVTVTIHRKEWKLEGGGRKLYESDVGTYTILLASQTGRSDNIDPGGRKAVASWIALTEPDVEPRWGSNVEDTFVVEEVGKFRITHARPVSVVGQISGYELQLELIA